MRTGKRLVFLVVATAILGAANVARADIVGPAPSSCPEGAYPETNHCGPFCAPRICVDDGDCDDGMYCQELELCIEVLDCAHSGGPFQEDAVEESCAGGGACSAGTCESLLVCAHPEPVGVPRQAGCGCRTGAGLTSAGGITFVMGLLLAAGLYLVRKRRRS